MIEEGRKAVKDDITTKDRYQQLAGDLQQALHMISAHAYQQAGAAGGNESQTAQRNTPHDDEEEVIDAEYKEY